MMLVQSSLPASIDDHGKQESSCVWIPSDDSWPKPKNAVPLTVHNIKNDSLWSPNVLSSSQLSTEVNMSETSTLNFVYRRRTIQKNANLCDIFLPNQSSKPTLVYKRRKIQSENSKSGSVDGGSLGDELIEDPKSKFQKCMVLRAVNDSCSSSKSNIDPGSIFLKHQVDDVGECSSTGVVIMEGANSCISFLKRHGVLERVISTKKKTGVKNNICCLRACKVCDQLATTLKMLICDLCEESFHMSCCNPVIKKVPVGDWFCHSCSRKKLKKMKEMNSSKLSKDCLGPIASMLRDVDYTSNVRIGEDFQAEVPDWISPLTDELNHYLEPMDMSPLECASYQELNPTKLLRLSSIGNWLQCRVVDGVDGTVCGKWRRAPLFEVQTDDWECFSSVLWDPTHADCSVRQELDTDQVLKQLKIIDMLRPRLSAKGWKSRVHKGVDQSEHTGDPRNAQKSKV